MKLILASNSPRRKDLLQSKGISFEVIVSDYNETQFTNNPIQTATEFAYGKAKSVFDSVIDKNGVVVLGADTVVFHQNEILGKAKTEEDARSMLKNLSGKTHSVVTGYALISTDKKIIGHCQSKVKFNDLTEELIDQYISSGLYKGKAGSYGIQDGYPLVESYTGDYNNIVGLPVDEIVLKLEELLK